MTHTLQTTSTASGTLKKTRAGIVLASLTARLLATVGLALLTSTWLAAASMDTAVKLVASDGAAYDSFGLAHAARGNTVVVGAHHTDHVGENAGTVYVFQRDVDGGWTETQELRALDAAPGDLFGNSIYLDEDLLVIGAIGGLTTHPGAVYIFERQLGVWKETAKITALDGDIGDMFGWSVGRFGNSLLIAAFNDGDLGTKAGAVYVYELIAGSWVQTQRLHAGDGTPGDCFGAALRVFGNRAAIGAYYDDELGDKAGSVYIFEHDGSEWVQVQKIFASDAMPSARFGASLELEDDVLVVSAYRDSEFADEAGAVYVFDHDGSGFQETQKLQDPNGDPYDHFGLSVAYSQGRLVVGAPQDDDAGLDSGSAYVYSRPLGGLFGEPDKMTVPDAAPGDFFGFASTLRGTTAVLSVYHDDDLGADSGSVYVVDMDFGLSAAGSCPGEVRIRIAEAAANGSVTLMAATSEGPGIVHDGPCVGTVIGLVDAQSLATVNANGKGIFSFVGSLSSNVCAYQLQAVDLQTCEVTEVVRMP